VFELKHSTRAAAMGDTLSTVPDCVCCGKEPDDHQQLNIARPSNNRQPGFPQAPARQQEADVLPCTNRFGSSHASDEEEAVKNVFVSIPVPEDDIPVSIPVPPPPCPQPQLPPKTGNQSDSSAPKPSSKPKPKKRVAKEPARGAPTRGGPSGSSSGAAAAGLSLDSLLADLEGAEEKAYGAAFAEMARGQALLPLDDQGLRDFLLTHTVIALDDLDTELIKVASETEHFSVDLPIFMKMLRDFSFLEGEALQFFMNTSDGNEFSAEDCRCGLLSIVQQASSATAWPEAVQEKVFDSIMCDAGLRIDMENWMRYCGRLGRVIRLMQHLRM